jgi:hypothetical protein
MRFCRALILTAAVLLIAIGAMAYQDSDNDGVRNKLDNCVDVPNSDQRDTDYDDFGDVCDNCTVDANHGQEDANGDGFGNRCDGDLNDDGVVGIPDFTIFVGCANHPGEGVSNPCKIADFDSDHKIDSVDFQLFEGMFWGTPGPSALAP